MKINTNINIIEITAEENYGYQNFFLEGLISHSDCFKIAPAEQESADFPTQGTSQSFTLAAVDEADQLMGVVSFQPITTGRQKLAHKAELIRMYVASEHAGKKIGHILITQLIERVKNKLPELEQINLNVATHNERAKKLYQKLGFEHFGTEINAMKFNGEYFDDDYMVLKLK